MSHARMSEPAGEPLSEYLPAGAFSEPGRCWRMVYANAVTLGAPEHCQEQVVWVGNHRLTDGKRIRVWSCDGHVEGLEKRERVAHR